MALFARALPVLGLFLVMACSPVVTGDGATSRDRYTSTFVTHAITRGPMPTALLGNPSALPAPEFRALTLSRLRLDGGFGAARFVSDPVPAPGHNFHLALAFNPADRSSAGDDLCSGSAAVLPAGGELFIKGAFCREGRALTTNFALLPTPNDFRAPAYEQALGQMMALLMPFQDPPGGGTDCARVGRVVPPLCR